MPSGVYIRTEFHKRKISESKKGVKRKPFTEETIRKMKKNHKGMINKNHTKKTKLKISKAHKGEKNYIYGKHHSEKSKMKMSESHIKYMCSGKILHKNTSIEIAIEDELKKVKLDYKKQVPIKINGKFIACVDFFLEKENIIIQCDGLYFHNLPKTKKRDATQELFFKLYGFKIFRFTDKEINKSSIGCIKKVLRYINLNN